MPFEGYPFYAGEFVLARSFTFEGKAKDKRYFLNLGGVEAAVIKVSLNGKEVGKVAWSPWQIEITDELRKGKNDITLTLVNTLRNLLGPHHHRDGELIGVGPKSFTGHSTWTGGGPGDPNWYDLRREGECKIWRDDYHHVAFGILAPITIEQR